MDTTEIIVLVTGVDRADDSLRIGYSYENQGGRVAYVSARAVLRGSAGHRAYTVLREPDDTLYVSLMKPPIPRGMLLVSPVVPVSCRLDPGDKFEDYIEIEIPVQELHPYCNPEYPED